uniref:Uncharacterized protein n=2 Tax=Cucumis melo TaxID=3656 RepID=A0A9I9EI36_CUCME
MEDQTIVKMDKILKSVLIDGVFVPGHTFNFKINERGDGGNSSTTDKELVTLCSEFLNGETDTTETVIEWGMAELIANE